MKWTGKAAGPAIRSDAGGPAQSLHDRVVVIIQAVQQDPDVNEEIAEILLAELASYQDLTQKAMEFKVNVLDPSVRERMSPARQYCKELQVAFKQTDS